MNNERQNNFEARQKELMKLTDQELKDKFWQLCNKAVEPMVESGKKYTSPSIERSILLRMGIDSVSSQAIVSRIKEAGLLKKGAGNVVLKVSKKLDTSILDAGQKIINDDTALNGLFS